MDLKVFLLLAIICMAICNAENKILKKEKSGENETHKMLKALFRKLEAIEARQHEQEEENEKRFVAIEKQLSILMEINKGTSVDVKKKGKLNDTSDLEERVSDLEMGLIAIADDLDELEESQVWQAFSYVRIIKRLPFIFPIFKIGIWGSSV